MADIKVVIKGKMYFFFNLKKKLSNVDCLPARPPQSTP